MFSQFEISNHTCANTLSNWVYSSALSRRKKNRTQWSLCYCMQQSVRQFGTDNHVCPGNALQLASKDDYTNNNQCRRKVTNPKLDSREELSTNLPSMTFQCQTEWLARNRFSLTRTMHTANVSLVLITESRLVYCIRWANSFFFFFFLMSQF